jgi:membrane protein DedA with SNARE-associated domain
MIDKLEQTILNTVQTIFDELGWLGVTIIMIVENATGLTPGEVVLGFAGWMLIDAHGLPFTMVFWGGLAAAIGSVIGSSMLYWAARIGGRPMVDRVTKFFHIDMHHIERVERMAARWGTGFIFFGRLVPGVRTLVAIPAGLTPIPFGTFAAATFAGAYIWCTLFIGIGYFLGHEWQLLSGIVKQAIPYVMMAGLLTGIGFVFWQFWLKNKWSPSKTEIK